MANEASRSRFINLQNLATSEQRWPCLRTNADFLHFWNQLFDDYHCEQAHDIFEGFDGGWPDVLHRLQRLYKSEARLRHQEVAELESVLQDIHTRGFRRNSCALKELQDKIDRDVLLSSSNASSSEYIEDDVEEVTDEAMQCVSSTAESDGLRPQRDLDGEMGIPLMHQPIQIHCHRCRTAEHPRPTRSNRRGTVHVLIPCDTCQHRWSHLHYGSSSERHTHEMHERNRIFAEVESVGQQRLVEFQRLLQEKKHFELQQLLDTWVLAEIQAAKFRQSAVDAAVAAHDTNHSMVLGLRSQDSGISADAHSAGTGQLQFVPEEDN